MKKLVVCALIFNESGQVLSVSRKTDPNDFGLPGGKVDDGEDLITALYREIKEETGLDIETYKEVFADHDGDYYAHTFLCTVSGEISTQEKGVVQYLDWVKLYTDTSFATYNKNLFNVVSNS